MGRIKLERLQAKPVVISWEHLKIEAVKEYYVYVDGECIDTVDGAKTSYALTNLEPYITYEVAVYYKNDHNELVQVGEQSENVEIYRTPDGLPVDICIFTVIPEFEQKKRPHMPKHRLHVLLIRRKEATYEDAWALPGGFSMVHETLEEAAKRELQEEAGVFGDFYLEQLKAYYKEGRDPRGWIPTVAYYALVNTHVFADIEKNENEQEELFKRVIVKELKADTDAKEARLFPVEEALEMNLAFDHKDILRDAYKQIKERLLMTTIAKEFLPQTFTLGELYKLITDLVPEFQVLETNFAKKFKAKTRKGIIQEVEGAKETRYSGPPAQLYRFTEEEDSPRMILSIYNTF